jgi:group I intron endonuclease
MTRKRLATTIGIIYEILNLVNYKRYIGSTRDPDRSYGHWKSLELGKHDSPHLQYSYIKYGKENFIFNIIEYHDIITDKELTIREQYYIDIHRTLNSAGGYNCRPAFRITMKETDPDNYIIMKKKQSASHKGKPGPNLGRKWSEETKKKMSEAKKGKPSKKKGKPISEETKRKISEALTGKIYKRGRHLSEEHKCKISVTTKGRPSHKKGKPSSQETKDRISKALMGNQYRKGIPHSEETKKKMSEIHKKENLSKQTRQKLSLSRKGKHHSEETKAKLSNANKGKPSPKKGISYTAEQLIKSNNKRRYNRLKKLNPDLTYEQYLLDIASI